MIPDADRVKLLHAPGSNVEEEKEHCGVLKDHNLIMSIKGVHTQYTISYRDDMTGLQVTLGKEKKGTDWLNAFVWILIST